MHYGKTFMSSNGQKTIATLDPAKQNIIGNQKGVCLNLTLIKKQGILQTLVMLDIVRIV